MGWPQDRCQPGAARPVGALGFDHHRDSAPPRRADGGQGQKAWKRFEHAAPNVLWQMDFKGDVAFGKGRLHPLTVVDDHSRYAVVLHAGDNERHQTVQNAVQAAFERYGLPEIILTDNGSPWGGAAERALTKLGVWLIEHGVAPWHSAPFHPQSHGKNERFNRTLKIELLDAHDFADLAQAQQAFDAWRHRYNHHRPHDALEPGGASRSLSPQPAPVQAQGRTIRVRTRRYHAQRRCRSQHQLPRQTHEGFQGAWSASTSPSGPPNATASSTWSSATSP